RRVTARTASWAAQTAQDIRLGLRGLRRNPTFSTIALLTLALGIGVNTAVYSIINVVLLHPLQYPQANRLVELSSVNLGSGIRIMSYLKFRRIEEQAGTLDAVA